MSVTASGAGEFALAHRQPDVFDEAFLEHKDDWDIIVGLEVHVELSTASKLFCGCANAFGSQPNTNVCPTCLGLPGSLPVMNEKAVTDAMRLGRALNCTVQPSVMARKNYFYPDMPKDFQTSQYDQPTNANGWLDLTSTEPDGSGGRKPIRISILRAHIEEDTGKSTHVGGDGRISSAQYSLIDYNRAGVPLLEIVTQPDFRTAEEAKDYVAELRGIVLALGVSDAKMEEGSMRVDANVSVRPAGSDELRTRCEIKNINSLSSLGRAIVYEAKRHIDLYGSGERPIQETRHWDEEAGRTRPGRSKENEEDYRYFAEPDLTPLIPSDAELASIDAEMPRTPARLRALLQEANDGTYVAEFELIIERGVADFALDSIAAGADATRVVVHLNNNLADGTGQLTPETFAALIHMEVSGDLSSTQTKDVLAEMQANGGDAAAIAAAKGFEAMDTSELDGMLDELIANHADEWDRFCGDDEGDSKKMAGFFTGQIMKATRGQADGKVVAQLMQSRRG
ncbi:MAG: Asp-tRNA(Asn)/Glu-tRNA(Gln) amidotransferase subunit GatB [Acidimicrobiia bacterium]|nr:Asp-tRNA(Asn)/Glu-tRNA(Gln) amidotransferase subunit GatB [Acidimicrobiia bacterium]